MKVIVDIDDQDITLPCVGKVATCSDCNHFVQHYGRRNDIEARVAGTRFYKTNCGHCTYPRIKNRSPETIACNHFELRNE
mgnify:CR=1 FL=1